MKTEHHEWLQRNGLYTKSWIPEETFDSLAVIKENPNVLDNLAEEFDIPKAFDNLALDDHSTSSGSAEKSKP